VFCIYSEQAPAKGREAEAKMSGGPENSGGLLMRWPRRLRRAIEPSGIADTRTKTRKHRKL